MAMKKTLAVAAIVLSAGAVQAQDSAIVLGKSSFGARCALCHGADAKGGGDIADLFQVPPSDLTTMTERNGGAFPFSIAYKTVVDGMGERAHGTSDMPIWGDYFLSLIHISEPTRLQ